MSAERATPANVLSSPWARSIRLYLALTPILAYSVWARVNATVPESPILSTLLVAAVAVGASAAYMWVAGAWLARRASTLKRPAAWNVALWISTATVTAVVISCGRAVIGANPAVTPATIILTVIATSLAMFVATLGAVVLSTRRQQLKSLEEKQRDLRRLQEDATELARTRRAALLLHIDAVVKPELRRLQEQAERLGDDPSGIALESLQANVAEFSQGVVRSLSHQMGSLREIDSAESRKPSESTSITAEIIPVLLSARLNGPVIGIMTLSLALAQFRSGCVGPLAMALGVFVVIETVLALIGKLPALKKRPWGLIWLILSALGGYLIFRSILIVEFEQCGWTTSGVLLTVGVIVASVTLLGMAAVIEATREARIAIAEIDRANDMLADVTRRVSIEGVITGDQMAHLLHGPVQGRLSAVSMALQLLLSEASEQRQMDTGEVVERVIGLLGEAAAELRDIIDLGLAEKQDADSSIADLSSRWRGLLAIDYECSEAARRELAVSPRLSGLAVDCVEEAVTNASRHGMARRVRVAIDSPEDEGGLLRIVVEDDGIGVSGEPVPGMGLTRIRLLGGTWSLATHEGGGSRLVVTLSPSLVT